MGLLEVALAENQSKAELDGFFLVGVRQSFAFHLETFSFQKN